MVVRISIRDPTHLKKIKTVLESHALLSSSPRKITKSADAKIIHILACTDDETPIRTALSSILDPDEYDIDHVVSSAKESTYSSGSTAEPTLNSAMTHILQSLNLHPSQIDELMAHLPRKWSVYPSMVLFKPNTFDHPSWQQLLQSNPSIFPQLLQAQVLNHNQHQSITHLAINKPIIESDTMRRPFNIMPLYGDFGPIASFDTPTQHDFEHAYWCSVVQNGIYQTWAPRYTMFSRGNIKEKARILHNYQFNTAPKPTWVADLYAGIGYFTLSYLKRAPHTHVFCWEINPWSIQGLVKGLTQNKFKHRVVKRTEQYTKAQFEQDIQNGVRAVVFHESNEFATSRLSALGEIDITVEHVNMGLLPSSQASWPICAQLLTRGTSRDAAQWAHVHENVHLNDMSDFAQRVQDYFQNELGHTRKCEVVHAEKVKTFAPDVWHVVFDLKCESQLDSQSA